MVIYQAAARIIQCNHGGMEPGYLPGSLLEAKPPIAFQFFGEMKGAIFEKASRPDEGG